MLKFKKKFDIIICIWYTFYKFLELFLTNQVIETLNYNVNKKN